MSTSKLQREVSRLLSIHLGGYIIRENVRPDWLIFDGVRVELDFYIEELSAAIEVQGEQHYHFVPMFHHNADGFKKRIDCDEQKRITCAKNGVRLFEVASLDEVFPVIDYLTRCNHQKNDAKFVKLLKKEIAIRTKVVGKAARVVTPSQIKKAQRKEKERLAAIERKAVRQERRLTHYAALSEKLTKLTKRWLVMRYNDPDLEKVEKRISNCETQMQILETNITHD